IHREFQRSELRIYKAGTRGQRRALSPSDCGCELSDRGLHVWRSTRPGSKQDLAAGARRGCDLLLETRLAGCRLRQPSGFVPDFSALSAREDVRASLALICFFYSLLTDNRRKRPRVTNDSTVQCFCIVSYNSRERI